MKWSHELEMEMGIRAIYDTMETHAAPASTGLWRRQSASDLVSDFKPLGE